MSTRRCPHCANAATAKKVLIDSFVGPYEMWHVTCNSIFCNKKSDLFKTKEAAEADWDAKFPIKDLYNKESYRFQLKDSEKEWLENRKDVCFRCGRDKTTECIYRFCYYAQCVGENYPMTPKRYALSGFSQDVAEFEARVALWLAKVCEMNIMPCEMIGNGCIETGPLRYKCVQCRLKHVRIAVEQEMEEELWTR